MTQLSWKESVSTTRYLDVPEEDECLVSHGDDGLFYWFVCVVRGECSIQVQGHTTEMESATAVAAATYAKCEAACAVLMEASN